MHVCTSERPARSKYKNLHHRGCSISLAVSENAYLSFSFISLYLGTRENTPPEYILNGEYEGPKEAVWTLGLLLYYVVCGDEPFYNFLETTMKPVQVPSFISSGRLFSTSFERSENDYVKATRIIEIVW